MRIHHFKYEEGIGQGWDGGGEGGGDYYSFKIMGTKWFGPLLFEIIDRTWLVIHDFKYWTRHGLGLRHFCYEEGRGGGAGSGDY